MTRPSRDGIITADASKVSPAQFFDALFPGLPSREQLYAEMIEVIIGRIERGDSLYGYPPLAVADARKLMDERALTDCRPDPLKGLEEAA